MQIGEFSDRSGISHKRLRVYAAEGVLVPAAVDAASGYRFYSGDQLRQAEVIDALRQADVPLAVIRELMTDLSEAHLDAWERQVDADAAARRRALARVREIVASLQRVPPPGSTDDFERATTMKLITAGCSETGPLRNTNEDVVVSTERLALVADGMGGLPGGDVASRVAATLIRATFTGRSLDELEAALRAANWAIWDRASSRSELTGMGTTACAVGLLDDGGLAVVNVGDSRAYLWHAGELSQLTADHTVTADLVNQGQISEDDAPGHPHFGVLTRVLGVAPAVAIDGARRSVVTGDRLMVCSDGLVNELSAAEIAGLMAFEGDVQAAAEDLVGLAIAKGGRDNVSAVIAEVAA